MCVDSVGRGGQCAGQGVLQRHDHPRRKGTRDVGVVGGDTHLALAVLDLVIGESEQVAREVLSVADHVIGLGTGLLGSVSGSLSVPDWRDEGMRLACTRARTVWQTRLRSGRFDCMTPTIGQSAWRGYLLMTVAIILYRMAWTVGSGWRIRDTNCGKAVRYCMNQRPCFSRRRGTVYLIHRQRLSRRVNHFGDPL